MTTREQCTTVDKVILLPQPFAGSQISSLSLFQDELYAGLTWPSNECPTDKASILKYDMSAATFEEVTGSETVEQAAVNENLFWQTGCHAMAVFRRKDDASGALYASMLTPSGCKLLMTKDGECVESLSLIDEGVLVHAMLEFNGYLFAATFDAARRPVIYCSSDPVAGEWKQACETGFADVENTSFTSMAEFNGSLYVATLNPTNGFQLWCTSADGAAPYSWIQVVSQGAHRYTLNPAIMSMTVFNGVLYIGTGPFGAMAECDINNFAAAELIRVFPDNSWEIVVGSPRFSPYGLKVPMAAMGPGFDSSAVAITALAVHDSRLIAASSYYDHANNSETGGFRIWSTADGEEWSVVSTAVTDTVNSMMVKAVSVLQNRLILATSDLRYSDPVTASAIRVGMKKSDKKSSLIRFAKLLLG